MNRASFLEPDRHFALLLDLKMYLTSLAVAWVSALCVCGKRVLLFSSVNCGTWRLRDTTTVVNDRRCAEALCVHAAGAWTLWGRSLYLGVKGEVNKHKGNEVVAACLTTVSV